MIFMQPNNANGGVTGNVLRLGMQCREAARSSML
jgi:hypothetical protein